MTLCNPNYVNYEIKPATPSNTENSLVQPQLCFPPLERWHAKNIYPLTHTRNDFIFKATLLQLFTIFLLHKFFKISPFFLPYRPQKSPLIDRA